MRHETKVSIEVFGSRKQIMFLGYDEWLLISGRVKAVFDNDAATVYYPDIQYSRAEQREINEYHRNATHSRVMPSDFDYYVAAAGMRALRPLLTKPQTLDTPTEEPL